MAVAVFAGLHAVEEDSVLVDEAPDGMLRERETKRLERRGTRVFTHASRAAAPAVSTCASAAGARVDCGWAWASMAGDRRALALQCAECR